MDQRQLADKRRSLERRRNALLEMITVAIASGDSSQSGAKLLRDAEEQLATITDQLRHIDQDMLGF